MRKKGDIRKLGIIDFGQGSPTALIETVGGSLDRLANMVV